MKQAYHYLSVLLILFFFVDMMRADGSDVLERIVRLPKIKGTVYSLLSDVSQQSGYMFIYDSKVIDNDAVVKIKGGERPSNKYNKKGIKRERAKTTAAPSAVK